MVWDFLYSFLQCLQIILLVSPLYRTWNWWGSHSALFNLVKGLNPLSGVYSDLGMKKRLPVVSMHSPLNGLMAT